MSWVLKQFWRCMLLPIDDHVISRHETCQVLVRRRLSYNISLSLVIRWRVSVTMNHPLFCSKGLSKLGFHDLNCTCSTFALVSASVEDLKSVLAHLYHDMWVDLRPILPAELYVKQGPWALIHRFKISCNYSLWHLTGCLTLKPSILYPQNSCKNSWQYNHLRYTSLNGGCFAKLWNLWCRTFARSKVADTGFCTS